MKKALFILATMLAAVSASAQNYILYTTSDGALITPNSFNLLTQEFFSDEELFGANIVSNTYEDGQGKILFDGDVTKLATEVFAGSHSLTSIEIPATVTEIGDMTFEYCEELEAFTGKLASEDNRCLILDGELKAFASKGLTSYSIPSTVTKIGTAVFEYCRELTTLEIPNTVTSIGNHAFFGCGFKNIELPSSITTIGDFAFCCAHLTSVEIPNSVTNFGNSIFRGCYDLESIKGKCASEDKRCLVVGGELNSFAPAGLTTYSVPTTVESIGDGVFSSCENLTEVEIPNSVRRLGDRVFYMCRNLSSIELPSSVTEVGEGLFQFCYGIKSFEIPASITTISDGMFMSCIAMESIKIPETVTEIGLSAFYSCKQLKTIEFPSSVNKIGGYLFDFCDNLTEIYSLNTTPPSMDEQRLLFINPDKIVLYVPESAIEAYKKADEWKKFKHIRAIETLGIQAPIESNAPESTFNLNGLKVSNAAKGIIIREGRKYIIR